MADGKKSFILHIDSLDILDELTNEEAGVLFKAIKSHQKGEDMILPITIKMAFIPFKNQFKRDDEKYDSFIEMQRIKGLKSSLSKKNKKQPRLTTVNSGQPLSTELTYNDSDSKNDSDSVSKKDKDTYRKFDHLSISVSDYEKVLLLGYTQTQIDDTLDGIQNYAKNKNYVSLYLTLLKWIKKEYGIPEKGKTQSDFANRMEYLNYCGKNNITPEPV